MSNNVIISDGNTLIFETYNSLYVINDSSWFVSIDTDKDEVTVTIKGASKKARVKHGYPLRTETEDRIDIGTIISNAQKEAKNPVDSPKKFIISGQDKPVMALVSRMQSENWKDGEGKEVTDDN